MGLLDQFAGAIHQVEALAPAALSTALTNTSLGDLGGLVQKLQQGGLNDQVKSWLSTNASNLPESADQLRTALGNEQVQQIARQLGLPVDEALQVLAQHLPNTVDQASPDGSLQSQ